MEPLSDQSGLTVAQHKDHFRGRCAIALEWNARIATSLANAIRISPMNGCTDLGAIAACREHMAKMAEWLDQAEESARAVASGESDETQQGVCCGECGGWDDCEGCCNCPSAPREKDAG